MNSLAYNKIFYKHYCKKNKTTLKKLSKKVKEEQLEKTIKIKIGGELYNLLQELKNFSVGNMSEIVRTMIKEEVEGTLSALIKLEAIEKTTTNTLYKIIEEGIED